MQQWQCKTLTYGWDEERQDLVWSDTKELAVSADMVDQRLNKFGRDGWELLCIEKMSHISHVAVSFYLKRPIQEK